MNQTPMQIIGWDVMSPYGGKAATAEAVAESRSAGTLACEMAGAARPVPDFDVRARLGTKGTRNFDRHTGLLAACMDKVIAEVWPEPGSVADAALINGTGAGSLSSILDFMLDTWRNERPYMVNPAHMPNTVINCAAGQCAIRHGIRGPNATLSAGSQSFYAGLRLAQRWMRKDYASRFLVGAVEELTPLTERLLAAWKEQCAPEARFAEGAGVFALEARPQAGRAAILHVSLATDTSPVPDLLGLVEAALDCAQLDAASIRAVCVESATGTVGREAENRVVRRLEQVRDVIDLAAMLGNSVSAAGALQLAALLTVLPPGEFGLLCSASASGSIACAIVRQAGVVA